MDVAAGMARFQGGEMDFRKWTLTIARRRMLDLRRARGRRRVDPVPNELLPEPRSFGDVESEALENLSTRSALDLIATLPPDQAEVVLLRVLGGLAVNDVASIVGKRPGTIRVLQHRALQRLASVTARDPATR